MPWSREEFDQKQAEKKQRREERRASMRVASTRASAALDAVELGQAEVQALSNYRDTMDEGDAEEDPILKCIQWLLRPPKHPPKLWETFRRDEIASYIEDTRKGLVCISFLVPESLLYAWVRRRRPQYYGEKNGKGQRDGRGIAFWPDPPYGGGGVFTFPSTRTDRRLGFQSQARKELEGQRDGRGLDLSIMPFRPPQTHISQPRKS